MTQNIILSRDCFKKGMKRLEVMFQDKKITEEFLKIYYSRLCRYTDQEFLNAVTGAIDNEQWFPTIAAFRKYLPSIDYSGMQ